LLRIFPEKSISANRKATTTLCGFLVASLLLIMVLSLSSPPSIIPPQSSGWDSSVLSTLVHSVQSRRWLALKKKTQRLDASTQGQLHDFLNDHLGNKESGRRDEINNNDDEYDENDLTIPDDYEVLQKQLDEACARQGELEEKGNFLKTRLESYQAKLDVMESIRNKRLIDESNEHYKAIDAARQSKLHQLKEALKPIKGIYSNLELELKHLQHQISSMHQRQMELKMKTQECKVVLEELEYTAMVATADNRNRPVDAGETQDGTVDDEEMGENLVMRNALRTTATTAPLEIQSISVVQPGGNERENEDTE
jgi:septal ring factor EnvC (AmiA/AmiB activator)